jgi:hypothetical protein
VVFWDARTGDEAGHIAVQEGSPISLAFSPDGQQLALSVRNETTSVYVYRLPGK